MQLQISYQHYGIIWKVMPNRNNLRIPVHFYEIWNSSNRVICLKPLAYVGSHCTTTPLTLRFSKKKKSD